MKALVKSKPILGLELQEIPLPYVCEQEVLIKVKTTSICGTDLHIYQCDPWAQDNIHLPVIIGH